MAEEEEAVVADATTPRAWAWALVALAKRVRGIDGARACTAFRAPWLRTRIALPYVRALWAMSCYLVLSWAGRYLY